MSDLVAEAEFDQLAGLYPIIGNLGPGLRTTLRSDLRPIHAPAGRMLFDLDSACSLFLLLAGGSIRVVKPAVSGREILLYRLQPGDSCILTVSCLLGHTSYPARGLVEHDLTAYAISEPLFHRLLADSAPFRAFVFRYFSERIADLMQLVEEVAFGPMDQRLANLLLERGPQVAATHQMIADELGTVREVVSRRLKQLEAAGLVRLDRGQIAVLDPRRLAQLAGPLRDSSH
jgi:CRP/FNR family transcriptional regulator